jgi:hypothetical protein
MKEVITRIGAVPENAVVEIVSANYDFWTDEKRKAVIGLKVRVQHPCWRRTECFPIDKNQLEKLEFNLLPLFSVNAEETIVKYKKP